MATMGADVSAEGQDGQCNYRFEQHIEMTEKKSGLELRAG